MISIFGEKLQKAITNSTLEGDTANARTWLRDRAMSVRSLDTKSIIAKAGDRNRTVAKIGNMYLFAYDAKTKDTLPYYDRFPLIFPFSRTPKGFYGINMHYLPLPFRARLMDVLYDNLNNLKMDETTRLKISYNILSSSSRYKFFKPCVKQYLNSQLDSRLIYIDPKEWDVALFLPLQKFQKSSTAAVYKDSRAMINKGR